MVEIRRKFKVVAWDHDGPSKDNLFVPSIVIQKDGGDRLCLGFRYNGGSSLDAGSYEYDHANRHRINRSWRLSRKGIEKELDGSNYNIEKLKKEYIQRIGVK